MSPKKKLGLLFCFIVLLIFIVISYLVINNTYQEYKLKKEINNIVKSDILEKNFNKDLVTTGDYRIVEKTIKDYLGDYGKSINNINNLINDEKFKSLLKYENLSTDYEFQKSIFFINNCMNTFNKNIENMIDLCNKDNIKNSILRYDLDKYYVDLYNELMFNENVISDLDLSITYLEEYKAIINEKFTLCNELFLFLNKNKGNYEFKDNELKFKTNELLNKFNEYVGKINEKKITL